jgi:hypothetical protein
MQLGERKMATYRKTRSESEESIFNGRVKRNIAENLVSKACDVSVSMGINEISGRQSII